MGWPVGTFIQPIEPKRCIIYVWSKEGPPSLNSICHMIGKFGENLGIVEVGKKSKNAGINKYNYLEHGQDYSFCIASQLFKSNFNWHLFFPELSKLLKR